MSKCYDCVRGKVCRENVNYPCGECAGYVAEPKKGKWISHNYEEDEVKTYMWAYEECSVCHKGVIEPTRYCPMCGAEMER